MNSLEFISKRNRKHPARKPGTREWCEEVKELALDRALSTSESGKLTSGDTLHLMKVRRGLIEKTRRNRVVTWVDPPHWQGVPQADPGSESDNNQPRKAA